MSTPTYSQIVTGNIRAEMGRQSKRASELAAVMSVSPGTVRRVLSDRGRALDLNELERISAWLDVSPRALAGIKAVKAAA